MLPKEYGNWHTIYAKLNSWIKNGALERIFEALQNEDIIPIVTNVVYIDSATVKVRPDGTRYLKKPASKGSADRKADSRSRFIWLQRLLNQP